MSHVKNQITIQEFTRNKVIACLETTDQRYRDFVFERGMEYLHDQLGSAALGQKLAGSPLFWAWWRNQWHDVEVEFLDSVKFMNLHERQEYYRILHDTRSIEYKPQRAIIADAIKHINNPVIKHQL